MEYERTPLESKDFREYSWTRMLAGVGTHVPRPERDTIGRVKMDYEGRNKHTTSETTTFNSRHF